MKLPKIHFCEDDRYFIDRRPYRYVFSDEGGACFQRLDSSNSIEKFSWFELHSLIGGQRWDCIPQPRTSGATDRAPDPFYSVWELPETQQTLLLNRWFFVRALRKLRSTNRLKLTPESVKENEALVHHEAAKEWSAYWGDFNKRYFSSKPTRFGFSASASSILRWNRNLKNAGDRLIALKDGRGKSRSLQIDQESFQFIMRALREYLSEQRFTPTAMAKKAVLALKVENERRASKGERPLETRSRSALIEWIARFPALEVTASREGIKVAREKFSAVGKTQSATRPGELFEIDEWEVDARTLITDSPVREGLDADTLKRLPIGRRWLYVVVDVATRYVVGFVVASTQNSSSAIRVSTQ